MTFPPLYQIFRSNGHINPNLSVKYKDTIAAFFAYIMNETKEDKEKVKDICSTVYSYPMDFELNNWNAVEIPLFTNPQSNAKLFYPKP